MGLTKIFNNINKLLRFKLLGIEIGVYLAYLIFTIFFFYSIFLGKVFTPADMQLKNLPWSQYQYPGYTGKASNFIRSDEVNIYLPEKVNFVNRLKSEGLPQYQDDNIGGSPVSYFMNYMGILFIPLQWPYLFFPPLTANTIYHIGSFYFAMLAMYLFSSRFIKNKYARFFMGLSWGFSTFMILWLSASIQSLGAAILPLALYMLSENISKNSEKFSEKVAQSIPKIILTGYLIAALIFIGYPPGTAIYGIIILLFIIYLLIFSKQDFKRRFIYISSSLVLAFIFALSPIYNDFSLLNTSSRVETPEASGTTIGLNSIHTFLLPSWMGDSRQGIWTDEANYNEYVKYVGIISIFIVILAFFVLLNELKNGSGKHYLKILIYPTLLIFIGLIITTRTPINITLLLDKIPVFRSINSQRWSIVLNMGLTILIGVCLEILIIYRSKIKKLYAVLAILIVIILIILISHSFIFHLSSQVGGDLFNIRVRSLVHVSIFIILSIITVTLFFIKKIDYRYIVGIISIVLVLDMFGLFRTFNPMINPSEAYPVTKLVVKLQNLVKNEPRPYFITWGSMDMFNSSATNMYGIPTLNGFDYFRGQNSIFPILQQLFSPVRLKDYLADGHIVDNLKFNDFGEAEANMLAVLRVKYILFPVDQLGNYDRNVFRLLFIEDKVAVFENIRYFPAFFSPDKINYNNSIDELKKINVSKTLLISDENNLTSNGCNIDDYERKSGAFLEVTVKCGPEGGYILTPAKYKDKYWSARTDKGEKLSLVDADGILKAIKINKAFNGKIILEYNDEFQSIADFISESSIIVCIVLDLILYVYFTRLKIY